MTPFPDDYEFSPLRVDLTGSDALSVDADWHYSWTLYTDATTAPYDVSWASETSLVLKERPTDSDANAVAVCTDSVVDATTLGTGYLFIARNTVAEDWIGKRLFYTFKAYNGTYWFPLLHGFIQIRNAASYDEDA